MQRRSHILVIPVFLLASFSLTHAAAAQRASDGWLRWDWSILNPGDMTSSVAARGVPEKIQIQVRALQSASGVTPAEVGSGRISGLLFDHAEGQLTLFPKHFARISIGIHRGFIAASSWCNAALEAKVLELHLAWELVSCSKFAAFEAASYRKADEYWSYYEARGHWGLSNNCNSMQQRMQLAPREVAELISGQSKVERGLFRCAEYLEKFIGSVGTLVCGLANSSALKMHEVREGTCKPYSLSMAFLRFTEWFRPICSSRQTTTGSNDRADRNFESRKSLLARMSAALGHHIERCLTRLSAQMLKLVSSVECLSLFPVEVAGCQIFDSGVVVSNRRFKPAVEMPGCQFEPYGVSWLSTELGHKIIVSSGGNELMREKRG